MSISAEPALTGDVLPKWQRIVDLMARIVGVPAGVIMRVNTSQIEVLVASATEGNPYQKGDIYNLDTGQYCECVISSRKPLLVANANSDPEWECNPDLKRGMVAYLGLPLLWPNGEIFGTIRVLDNKENPFSNEYRALIAEFKEVIESDLRKLVETERQLHSTENALLESEERLANFFEASFEGLFLHDRGKILDVNPATTVIFGYRPKETMGKNLIDFVAPDFKEIVVARMAAGAEGPYEVSIIAKSGAQIPVEVRAKTVKINGKQMRVVGLRDISDRKRAELALEKSERKYRELVDAAATIILRWDIKGNITFFNEYAQKFFGFTEEEILGKNVVGTIVPETEFTGRDLALLMQNICLNPSKYEDNENENMKRNGERVWIAWKNRPMFNQNGEIFEIHSVGIDITARKQAEDAVRASEERISKAHNELEMRVQERTAELKNINEELKREIAERQLAEQALEQERRLFVTGPTVVFKWRAQEGWPVEYVSPNVSSQFGYEPQDLISGKIQFASIVHPDDIQRVAEEVQSYSQAGVAHFEQEYRIVDSNNVYHWLYDLTVVVRNQKMDITHYHGYVIDITERKQAEGRILASEGELRGILDSLQEVYYRADIEGNIVRVSPSMQQVFGYSPEEVAGKPTTMVWRYPEKRQDMLEAMRAAGGVVHNYEAQSLRKNGEIFWTSINAHFCKDEQGNILGVEGAIRDVTQRKLAEQEMLRSRQYFQSLDRVSRALAEAPDLNAMLWNVLKEVLVIFAVDRAWLLYPCNPEATHWSVPIEVTRSEFEGIYACGSKIYRDPEVVAVLQDVVKTLDPVTHDYFKSDTTPEIVRHYDIRTQMTIALHPKIDEPWLLGMHQCSHNRKWSKHDMRLFRDIGERITHALTNRLLLERLEEDIKVRKQAEKELEYQKTIFESLFRDVPDAMVLTDTERNILMCNPALTRIFGYEQDELISEKTAVLYQSLEEYERQGRIRFNLTAEEKAKPYVVNYKRKNGGIFPGETVGTAIKTDSGTTLGFIGVIRDITERLQAEEQAKLHQAELAHMARLNTMGELATGIAHELNQPLAAIANYAAASRRMLESGIKHPEKMVTALESTQIQAERASEIIRRLRQFVKKQSPRKTTVNINTLVQDVVAFMESEMKRHEVKMQLELAEQLPLVIADAIQIEQVLLNLVRNGLDAMKMVDEKPRVLRISTYTNEKGFVQAEVVDTGPGVDQDALHKVFEPFITTKGVSGLGMGLSISRSIIEAHDGKLWAESEVGRGASFYFTLPMVTKI